MLIGCLYTVREMNDNIRYFTVSGFKTYSSCDVQHLYSTYLLDDYIHIN